MEILFNEKGTPLMLNSHVFFGDTVNDGSEGIKKRDILAPFDVSYMNRETVRDHQVVRWGKNNMFPLKADDIIASTSVLNTGLKFLRQLTIGQATKS